MKKVRSIVIALVWLLPASTAKNALLRALGHNVHPGAIARSNVVWRVGSIEMAAGSRIGKLNVIKDVRLLKVGLDASIGKMNLISAHPIFAKLFPTGASLILEDHAYITSRHTVDCAARVTVGRYAAVAGHKTTILTHSIDLRTDSQSAAPVTIGERSFVATDCLILGGAELPARSVLAAGAVLSKTKTKGEPGLWGGVPAKRVGEVSGEWFSRSKTHTYRVHIPETDETVENAF